MNISVSYFNIDPECHFNFFHLLGHYMCCFVTWIILELHTAPSAVAIVLTKSNNWYAYTNISSKSDQAVGNEKLLRELYSKQTKTSEDWSKYKDYIFRNGPYTITNRHKWFSTVLNRTAVVTFILKRPLVTSPGNRRWINKIIFVAEFWRSWYLVGNLSSGHWSRVIYASRQKWTREQ